MAYREYTTFFKIKAVEISHDTVMNVSQIAGHLGVSPATLYRWRTAVRANPATPFPLEPEEQRAVARAAAQQQRLDQKAALAAMIQEWRADGRLPYPYEYLGIIDGYYRPGQARHRHDGQTLLSQATYYLKLYHFIDAQRERFPVTLLCRLLDVARTSYYSWRFRHGPATWFSQEPGWLEAYNRRFRHYLPPQLKEQIRHDAEMLRVQDARSRELTRLMLGPRHGWRGRPGFLYPPRFVPLGILNRSPHLGRQPWPLPELPAWAPAPAPLPPPQPPGVGRLTGPHPDVWPAPPGRLWRDAPPPTGVGGRWVSLHQRLRYTQFGLGGQRPFSPSRPIPLPHRAPIRPQIVPDPTPRRLYTSHSPFQPPVTSTPA